MWSITIALACMSQHIDTQAQMLLSFTEEKRLVGTG